MKWMSLFLFLFLLFCLLTGPLNPKITQARPDAIVSFSKHPPGRCRSDEVLHVSTYDRSHQFLEASRRFLIL
jgi:hypothetical protein